jgi:RNA polymerase sigma-70 factor (ECF subfamily)
MAQYERPLHSFLVFLLHDIELARDCAQDTFLRAYEHLLADRAISAGWLYTVARHRAMDEFRRRRRLSQDEVESTEIVNGGDRELALDVWETLGRLPAAEREVLYLFVIAGFRTDEIGAMLGVRGSAIRQRLYRARQRFRSYHDPDDE